MVNMTNTFEEERTIHAPPCCIQKIRFRSTWMKMTLVWRVVPQLRAQPQNPRVPFVVADSSTLFRPIAIPIGVVVRWCFDIQTTRRTSYYHCSVENQLL